MTAEIQAAKSALRGQMRTLASEFPVAERQKQSSLICERLTETEEWRTATSVLLFSPRPDEPDILPLLTAGIASGKAICLPRYDAVSQTYTAAQLANLVADCQLGKFGILEPTDHCAAFPLKQLDLALVPGVCFDLSGNRLGRGKGFYDRLLTMIPGKKCGLAFDWQVASKVPDESHDVRLNCILTPTRWHRL